MREVGLLLRLKCLSLFSINRVRHARDAKVKARYRLMLGVWIVLLINMGEYISGLVYGLTVLGLGTVVPTYLVMLTSLLLVFFGIVNSGGALFSKKGYEELIALPFKPTSVVYSRLAFLYLQNLLLVAGVMLVGGGTYAVLQRPSGWFYLSAAVGIFVIPILPLVIATVLGTLVTALASHTKHKSLWQSGLSVLVMLSVILIPSIFGNTEDFSAEQLTALAVMVERFIAKFYPPATWLGAAMTGKNPHALLLFVGISLVAALVMVLLVLRCFPSLMHRLHRVSARKSLAKTSARRSVLRALYIREMRRYFASSIYVTNTIIGPVFGCVMVGVLCFVGTDAFTALFLTVPNLAALVPLAYAAVCSMMTTTSVSLSMEGKNFWVVQSLPVSAKPLFDSKLLVGGTLMLPSYAVAQVFMAIALRPQGIEWLWMLLMPAAILAFALVCGIAVNIRSHRFDWDKEAAVVKQSAAAVLGGFAAPLVTFLLVAGCVVFPAADDLVRAIGAAGLLAVTAWLYRHNNRVDLRKL